MTIFYSSVKRIQQLSRKHIILLYFTTFVRVNLKVLSRVGISREFRSAGDLYRCITAHWQFPASSVHVWAATTIANVVTAARVSRRVRVPVVSKPRKCRKYSTSRRQFTQCGASIDVCDARLCVVSGGNHQWRCRLFSGWCSRNSSAELTSTMRTASRRSRTGSWRLSLTSR